MKETTGDLVTMAQAGDFDAIIHGVNCQKRMRSGIAKQIRKAFPAAYTVYMDTEPELGNICSAQCGNVLVINAFTQDRYGYDGKRYVSYDAIQSCFNIIQASFSGSRFGVPLIGAGLAGGDWKRIRPLINKAMRGENLTLVKL